MPALTEEQKRILESGQPVSDAPLWQERQDVESGKVTETSAYARIPTGVLEKETGKVYPIITSDKGKEIKQQADLTMAGLTQPVGLPKIGDPIPGFPGLVYEESDIANLQSGKPVIKEPEKKEEPTITWEEAGTTPTGEKMYLDPISGLIKPISQIQREQQEKADIEAKVNQQMSAAEQELASLKSQMASYKISDEQVQGQVNTITQRWDAQIAQMRDVNTRRQEHMKTLGTRLGSRWAGGMGGVFGGIIAEEERAGILRIGELEAQKQSAIQNAKDAAQKKNWDIYVQEISLASESVKLQREKVQEMNKMLVEQNKARQDAIQNELKQFELEQKVNENLAPIIASNLTGNEEYDSQLINAFAAQYDRDPNFLKSAVSSYQTKLKEYGGGDIGLYSLYTEQERNMGREPVGIMDFLKMKEEYTGKPSAGEVITTQERLTAQQNLRKEFNALPVIKDFNIVKTANSRIQSAYKEAISVKDKKSKAPADQTLIVSFNKMLDPGSVVREGEFARSTEGQSLLAQFQGKIQSWQTGGVGLTDTDRKSVVEMTNRLYNDYLKIYNEKVNEYRGYAEDYGANPDAIVKPSEEKISETEENTVILQDPKTGEKKKFTGLTKEDIQEALSKGFIQF